MQAFLPPPLRKTEITPSFSSNFMKHIALALGMPDLMLKDRNPFQQELPYTFLDRDARSVYAIGSFVNR